MTFSIVACDLNTGEFGVAVQSKFFAVGAAVPYARAGAGAVATQAWFDPSHGLKGLQLLESGATAADVIAALLAEDPKANGRQLGVVDRTGRAAAHTGPGCSDWAGHEVGDGFCCQGNILAGPAVVAEMAKAFRQATGPLPERMVAALAAGQEAGGDRRGKQSAALYVARADSGFGWLGDRYIDIRVDDHPEPIQELSRLLATYRDGFWGRMMEPEVPLNPGLIEYVQSKVGVKAGEWDAPTREAVQRFCTKHGINLTRPLDGATLPRQFFQTLMQEENR
jgi:uncharacterized Ntn-hydrolase superfamily protein